MSASNFFVGLDVHKDSVTIGVFRNRDAEPTRVDRLPGDHKLLRYFQRLGAEGSVRACYEASGAGYVLQRALTEGASAVSSPPPPSYPADRAITARPIAAMPSRSPATARPPTTSSPPVGPRVAALSTAPYNSRNGSLIRT